MNEITQQDIENTISKLITEDITYSAYYKHENGIFQLWGRKGEYTSIPKLISALKNSSSYYNQKIDELIDKKQVFFVRNIKTIKSEHVIWNK
jgi:hypothetical protein